MTQSLATSAARQPRGAVFLNGTEIPWTEWEVSTNSFYRADSFTLSAPMSAMPTGLKVSDLSNIDTIEADIRVSVDGSTPASLVLGNVDDFDVDWSTQMIHMKGRDKTALFLDNRTAENFRNQTSSQVVQTLAARRGLMANVTATTTKIGHYYEIDHDRMTDDVTEWQLLCWLAQEEGFSVWVSGSTLNFVPVDQVQGTPIPIAWTPPSASWSAQAPFMRLTTKRNLTLASDVIVNVLSWNHKQSARFQVQSKAQKARKSQVSGGAAQVYTFVIPGLTKDKAQQIANAKAEDISRHERLIEIEMAMDTTLTARNQVQISGTGTTWDQLYWVDEVSRRMSIDPPEVIQTVAAKNHSPQSIVSI